MILVHYPSYITNHRDHQIKIDLLYLEKHDNTHYCLIKDLNGLFSINGMLMFVEIV